MNELVISVVAGLIVIIVASVFGLGNTTHVVVHGGGKILRSGKWIMVFSSIAFFVGLNWAQSETSMSGVKMVFEEGGSLLAMYSVLFFFIGKFVAWMQR